MAVIYVAGTGNDITGNGSSGNPYRSITKALNVASANDTILVRNGTYSEAIKITKNGITLKADDGHTPVMDGNYGPWLISPGSGKQTWQGKKLPDWNASSEFVPGKEESTEMISINAHNVTVQGMTLRNIAGEGIGGGHGNNIKILNNTIDWCYGSGINFNRGNGNQMNDLEIAYNKLTRCSVKIYCPGRKMGSGQRVAGTMKVGSAVRPWIHHNELGWGYGEGMNPGKYNQDALVEYNVVHSMNHASFNCNRSSNTILRHNLAYHTGDPAHLDSDGNLPPGLTWSDEDAGGSGVHSDRGAIYNNLFIMKRGMEFRNKPTGNYDLQFDRTYIGYNTIVCPKWTFKGGPPIEGIMLFENERGKLHKNSIFENNLILVEAGPDSKIANTKGSLKGIAFRNNCWSALPPSNVRGTNDQIGDPKLSNPFATIVGPESNDVRATTLGANNYAALSRYRPTPNSTLIIGRASNGSATNGLTPPNITTDYGGATRTNPYDIGAIEFNGVVANSVIASFTQSPSSGEAPLTVSFNSSSSSATGSASINKRTWNFGDGSPTSSTANPSHEFEDPGTYTVTLTVEDTTLGLSDSTTRTVTVSASEPTGSVTADFSQSVSSGVAPLSVQFTNNSSASGVATINSVLWNFGDGATSTQNNPLHIFQNDGTYTVTLTVRDTTLNLIDTATRTVHVGELVGSFTQSATSGQAPLEVTFTDTSTTAGGVVIDTYAWNFGDGNTSDDPDPTHTYLSPGVYTPSMTVSDSTRGISSVFVGDPITVSSGPGAGSEGAVLVRSVRAAINTTEGEQTITASLGGLIPKAVRLVVVGATADGTAADDAIFGVGAATSSTQQWACCTFGKHNESAAVAVRRWTSNACLMMIDDTAAVTMEAEFVSFVANGVKLNITNAPASAYLVIATFYAGTGVQARAMTVSLGKENTVTDITSIGFRPHAVFSANTWLPNDTGAQHAQMSLGWVVDDGENPPASQYFVDHYYIDGSDPTDVFTRISRNRFMHTRDGQPDGFATMRGLDFDAQGFSIRVYSDNVNMTGLLLVLRLEGARVLLSDVGTRTTTGSQDYEAPGWQPQHIESLLHQSSAINTQVQDPTAGSFGIHVADENGEFTQIISNEVNVGTTNDQSLSDNQLIIPDDDGGSFIAATTTLISTGHNWSFSAATATARRPIVLWIEDVGGVASDPDTPVAQFVGSPLEGKQPLTVDFTNLSAGSGNSYEWDFGDGNTSTDEHPTNVYEEPGAYTVTLTATNNEGEHTETKEGYITVHTSQPRRFVIGPVVGKKTTAESENTNNIVDDQSGEVVDLATHTHQRDLAYLLLGILDQEPEADDEKMVMWIDSNTLNLKYKLPDGTVKTITAT